MRQPSPRTYLLISGAIAGALLGSDLVRLVATGRLPSGELRHAALTAAGLFAAMGLTSQQTQRTLELARRIERARTAEPEGGEVVRFPTAVRS